MNPPFPSNPIQQMSAFGVDLGTVAAILVVIIAALVALRLLGVAVRRVTLGILQREKETPRELAQKAKTLSQVVEATGRAVIATITILTLLSLVGKDITPLLASAGIVGIAIGFGAQNLIKDWLGGFFILLENQYSVDDVIKVGEYSGVVESLNLRKTVLRNVEGGAIVIPNGEIRVVTNLTKEWSRAVLDVGISYDEDVDRAIEVLKRAGEEIAADEAVGKLVVGQPEVLGVEALGDYQVTLRMLVKTLPLQQWTVARALRARVKRLFDQEGIQKAYPRQINITRIQPSNGEDEGLSELARQLGRSE